MTTHRTLALALGLFVTSAAVEARAQRAIRFADMDVNHDGVITQREWRGSTRAFQMQDWNGDGILSGDEVRPGARRPAEARDQARPDTAEFTDWTSRGFTALDDNRDGRVSRDEWHFEIESFRRADRNRDGVLSRAEFIGEQDERGYGEDRGPFVDANNDGRVSRAEWRGTAERFDVLDVNRDGQLTRSEMRGGNEPPPDLFTSVDLNRDGAITREEWNWSRATFDRRDQNRDGRLTREEFAESGTSTQTEAWRLGRDRGLIEGRQAGKEDKDRNQGWDLEGQRELETADSGYQPQFGSRTDYQAGYREGFRQGYREGWGPR